jgi:hypothetical protein
LRDSKLLGLAHKVTAKLPTVVIATANKLLLGLAHKVIAKLPTVVIATANKLLLGLAHKVKPKLPIALSVTRHKLTIFPLDIARLEIDLGWLINLVPHFILENY